MSAGETKNAREITVDVRNLYREEVFTDLSVLSLRRLMPVKPDGSSDEARQPLFIAQTHVMTNAGPLPVQCPVEAATLEEAIRKFPEAIRAAVEKMIEEVKELQRQESSRIILPGEAPGPGPLTLK